MSGLPLHGITVIAVEQAVAAPLATRHLADLGARVIKVERCGDGDFARHYDAAVRGLASHFVWLNRGKQSLAVDLKHPDGVAVVHQLIAGADVVVQNLAPGAAERLGLGAQHLREKHPSLIVATLRGYGATGPYRDRKAYDMLVQAETGLCSITGTPDGPAKAGVPVADIATAMYALSAIQAALFRRERSGQGATVEVSMFDATTEWLGHPMYIQRYRGEQTPRMGMGHAAIAPYDTYPTADGQILIGVQNDRGWRALVTDVFTAPALADDPRFATNIDRVEHRGEVDAVVAEHTRVRTTADLEERLAAAGVPAARLNTMADLVAHPELADRWRRVDTEAGPIDALAPPMNFADVALAMGPVPALGEHTDALLAEIDLTAERIADLHARRVVQ